MKLHSKYTDYKIINNSKESKILEHIINPNQIIRINYYKSGQIQCKWWYVNQKWHREDGPAIMFYYRSGRIKVKQWYLNNHYHREDGPAIIWYTKSGNIINQKFFLNGIQYTYTDFIQTPEYQAALKQQSQHIFD